MRISQIHQDALNEDIRNFFNLKIFPYKLKKGKIFRRKKEKMLKMCGGINKIQTNIKTINDFLPEKKAADRLLKRVNLFYLCIFLFCFTFSFFIQFFKIQSAKIISTVLLTKKVIEAKTIQKKKDEIERREMIHLIRQTLNDEKREGVKLHERQLKWFKILNLIMMIDVIRKKCFREIIYKRIKSKQKIVYQQVWSEWKLMLYARGSKKEIRNSWDSLRTVKMFTFQQKNQIKVHAKKICADFLKKTALFIGWNSKLIEYREESKMSLLN